MDDISLGDIEQLFCGNLVLHKGTPVLFKSVNRDRQTKLFNLFHGKEYNAEFKLDDFGAPRGRIGFVNHGNTSVYVFRRPRRQFCVGVTGNNSEFKALHYLDPYQRQTVVNELKKLDKKALHFSMLNQYPKFSEALEKAIAHDGAYAFDKQFAIGRDRVVWYKTTAVGVLKEGKTSMKDIVFDKQYEYLKLPLLQDHGKVERTFESQ